MKKRLKAVGCESGLLEWCEAVDGAGGGLIGSLAKATLLRSTDAGCISACGKRVIDVCVVEVVRKFFWPC